MKEKYTRDNKLLKIVLTESLYFIIAASIFTPFYFYFREGKWLNFDLLFFKIFAVIIAIYHIPTLLIYLNYYRENKNTRVNIDSGENSIEITKNGKKRVYKISDIKSSIYNLGIYHKNKFDNARRWKMLNSDLAYWDIEFENGDRYYISNMIVDFLHEVPFVENTKYRFRLFQFIDGSDAKAILEIKKQEIKSREDRLRYLYQDKTIPELEYIVENKNLYMENARKVAEEMLKERKNVL